MEADGPLGPAQQMALTGALLRRVSRGELTDTLRVFRPSRPMVAFGRRDTRLPGFPAAARLCREAGFVPVARPTGGRAVACTTAALVVDHIARDRLVPGGMTARFEEYGALLAGVLAEHGIDARVGEVPGEYCPGAHSVNARGEVKLIGTAQRVVRDAWLFSSVVVYDDADLLRPLLAGVYDALELPFDPASVGAVADEATLSLDALETAIEVAYAVHAGPAATVFDEVTTAEAATLVADYEVRDF
ncbi:lipoate--protein ligase family protein [Nocardioides speluncae]|uniref:lipoate--protein ligase family protein n=1 Tax=Nocardioides speluncae TaxID=2670337 RepID=UPI000D68CFEF|nr:lipoate--protein ligase family protein [Nocardioides speluncae]